MKKLISIRRSLPALGVLLLVGVLILTGCASEPAVPAGPTVTERIGLLESQVAQLAAMVAGGIEDPSDLRNAISSLQTSLASLEEGLRSLQSRLDSLDASVADLAARVASLESLDGSDGSGEVTVSIIDEELPLVFHSNDQDSSIFQFEVEIANETNKYHYVLYSLDAVCISPEPSANVSEARITVSTQGFGTREFDVTYVPNQGSARQILFTPQSTWNKIVVPGNSTVVLYNTITLKTKDLEKWQMELTNVVVAETF